MRLFYYTFYLSHAFLLPILLPPYAFYLSPYAEALFYNLSAYSSTSAGSTSLSPTLQRNLLYSPAFLVFYSSRRMYRRAHYRQVTVCAPAYCCLPITCLCAALTYRTFLLPAVKRHSVPWRFSLPRCCALLRAFLPVLPLQQYAAYGWSYALRIYTHTLRAPGQTVRL